MTPNTRAAGPRGQLTPTDATVRRARRERIKAGEALYGSSQRRRQWR
ncbi:MAG TPA: hypothetical protein VE196_01230 [Pseudonocardiaceae bacterium]|nr:hypothetical protein [Pseudonocardiaceae bacterium]